MAGTRLLIQTIVVLEILVLTGMGLWLGLCRPKDQLCTPLWGQAGRRSLQATSINFDELKQPELSIMVSNSNKQIEWKKTIMDYSSDEIEVVVDPDLLKRVCVARNEALNDQETVYICPSQAKEELIPTSSSLFVYPSTSNSDPISLFRKIKRITPSNERTDLPGDLYSLKITFQVEQDQAKWQSYASSLQAWIQKTSIMDWPCWKKGDAGVQSEVVFGGDLSSKALPVANSTSSSRLNTKDIHDWIGTRKQSLYPANVEVLVYVPSNAYLTVKDRTSSSSAVKVGKTLVSFVDTSSDDIERAVSNSLSYMIPFVQSQIPGLAFEEIAALSPALRLPSWYTTLWLQRKLRDSYHRAKYKVDWMQRYMLNTSYDVAITQEIAEMWFHAVQKIHEGLQAAQSGEWIEALDSFQASIQQIEALERHPDYLMPPKDFSPEHAMAVFAPLLFPLLVPMLGQLVREYKRFKKLKNKKVTR